MQSLIPAAELGARFLPRMRAVPKEMLPIRNKPATELLGEEMRRGRAEELVVVIILYTKDLMRTLRALLSMFAKQMGLSHPYVLKVLYCAIGITLGSVMCFAHDMRCAIITQFRSIEGVQDHNHHHELSWLIRSQCSLTRALMSWMISQGVLCHEASL